MLYLSVPNDHCQDDWEFILGLYERFQRLMYRTAVAYYPQEAEDLIQDVLICLCNPKVVETLRALSPQKQAGYIVKTISNTAINQIKRKKACLTCSEADTDETAIPDDALSPEELMLLAERADEFYACFRKLGETDQLLLKGKYILELSDRELAEQLGCQPASIRMKLTRARRRALVMFQKGAYFSEQK